MRVWDIPVSKLCNKHLLGEHGEIHAIWNILIKNSQGYGNHPETRRWEGKLKALYNRHEENVQEMMRRGFKHKSSLDSSLAGGRECQDEFVNTREEQLKILKGKKCGCVLDD